MHQCSFELLLTEVRRGVASGAWHAPGHLGPPKILGNEKLLRQTPIGLGQSKQRTLSNEATSPQISVFGRTIDVFYDQQTQHVKQTELVEILGRTTKISFL